MLTRNELKMLIALRRTRDIKREGMFIAAGAKLIDSLISGGMQPLYLLTDSPPLAAGYPMQEVRVVDAKQLERISTLDSPTNLLGLFPLPVAAPHPLGGARTLVLDDVQDPGNLGSIVRTASWCGFSQVICSTESAFLFAPKAIQATMGAAASMQVAYCRLEETMRCAPPGFPIIAAMLSGTSCRRFTFPQAFALVLGNEGRGVSSEILAFCSQRITIPCCGSPAGDSLNAAAAAAILCYEASMQATARPEG